VLVYSPLHDDIIARVGAQLAAQIGEVMGAVAGKIFHVRAIVGASGGEEMGEASGDKWLAARERGASKSNVDFDAGPDSSVYTIDCSLLLGGLVDRKE